jgi:hypothetical protein
MEWQKREDSTVNSREELFFRAGGNIYRQREFERGGEGWFFRMSKLKLQSYHVALRLLSPCSQVAPK